MNIPVNNLHRANLIFQTELEKKALEVIRSGWFVLGKEVDLFEKEYATKLGVPYCIGIDNGLNAIKLGCQALGIGIGDEVIMQANTYIATVLGVTWNGATPIFVEPNEFYNIDVNLLNSKITTKTKAVLVTHLYGQTSEMDSIVDFCKENNLFLLEDCAQSHFSKFDDRYSGTFGDLGFFSFYPTKNLGALGDAGCVVTKNEHTAMLLKMFRNYGSKVRYQNLVAGHNARLDELQAAFLRIKLNHMDAINHERNAIAERYNTEIINPKILKPRVEEKVTHVWHLYVVQVEYQERFRTYLKTNGIQSDVHYPTPPHLSEAYKYLGYHVGDFPITEKLSHSIVSIPIFNGMQKKEIDYIIKVINEYE